VNAIIWFILEKLKAVNLEKDNAETIAQRKKKRLLFAWVKVREIVRKDTKIGCM